MTRITTPAPPYNRVHRMTIELLALDLTTCEPCLAARHNLDEALGIARDTLVARGTQVDLRTTIVTSEAQAREHRMVASPTIRVDGRDVGLELREAACPSPACCGADGAPIDCRIWVHDGVEHTEPPVAMLVEAIVDAAESGVSSGPIDASFELPDNLARFFADRDPASTEACCSPDEQSSCCEPGAKESCCGSSSTETCRCR